MKNLIIVRGGGDLATGSIYKLKKSGFPVLILNLRILLPFDGMWLSAKRCTREVKLWKI